MKEDGIHRPLFTNCLTIEKSFDMIIEIFLFNQDAGVIQDEKDAVWND